MYVHPAEGKRGAGWGLGGSIVAVHAMPMCTHGQKHQAPHAALPIVSWTDRYKLQPSVSSVRMENVNDIPLSWEDDASSRPNGKSYGIIRLIPTDKLVELKKELKERYGVRCRWRGVPSWRQAH